MVQVASPQARAFRLTRRLYDVVPLSPAWIGVLFWAGLYSAFLLLEWLLGRTPIRLAPNLDESGEALITLLLCALLAYLVTATVYALREAPLAVRRVRDLLAGGSDELDELERQVDRRPAAAMFWSGVLGAGFALALPLLEPMPSGESVYNWRYWTPESTWHRALTPLLGWWTGRLAAVMLVDSRRYSELAARIDRIDLLDVSPLVPFARLGLSNALRIVGAAAILSIFLVDVQRYGVMVLLVALATGAGVTAAVLRPVRGVHERIRIAKSAELARVNGAIRGEPGALADSALASRSEAPSLADLVAYRQLVDSAREWPFDSTTFLRFALYLMIPLGSWMGGALVERLLDAALD